MVMTQAELTQVQNEIYKVLQSHKEKALITEAFLTKTIRLNLKIEGKNKACLALNDIEKALSVFNELNECKYSIYTNSAHDLLLRKSEQSISFDPEAKKRRQASEKSMTILTASDLNAKKSVKPKAKKRTETKHLNIYSNFEEYES